MVDIYSDEYITGQNIRKYRLAKGWSQMDLANTVDVNRTDISKYENGSKGVMGYKTLKKFAKALDVTIDQLTGDEEVSGDSTIQNIIDQLSDSNRAMAEQMLRALLLQQNTITK